MEFEETLNLQEADYYSILNVARDASSDEIKAAYKRWCLLFHPDKQNDEEKKRMAERQFLSIQRAYSGTKVFVS